MNRSRTVSTLCAAAVALLLAAGAAPALAGGPLIPDITGPETPGPDFLPTGGWRAVLSTDKGKRVAVWLAFSPGGTFVMNMKRDGRPLATAEGAYKLTGEALDFTVKGKPFMAGKVKVLGPDRWVFANGKQEQTFERLSEKQLARELEAEGKSVAERPKPEESEKPKGDAEEKKAGPGPKEAIVGTWLTLLPVAGDAPVKSVVIIKPDGTFSLAFELGGKVGSFEGTYRITGDDVVFLTADGKRAMAGTVSVTSASRWSLSKGKEEQVFIKAPPMPPALPER